jgi:hypothetical protein
MTDILQHTFASKFDIDTNVIRSSSLTPTDFNKIKEREVSGELFGVNSKDVIEFSAFTQNNELVGWKTIQQTPNYSTRAVSYLNSEGVLERKNISYLKSLYPKTSDGNILVSPKYELNQLGLRQGEYKVRISYRNDIVGSFENPYKLQIKEISGSRTEIKAVTQSFKNSRNPNQISFNFEYGNFLNKQTIVAHIIEKLENILKSKTFVSELESKEFSKKTSDYSMYINKAKKAFSLTELQILKELDSIYTNLKDVYKNYLYGSYNEVFSQDRFYTDYINLVDYTLNTFSRFVQENNTDLKLFYKYMMIQMFDEDEVSSVFEKRFDTYLLNGMNFGNGLFVPFLKYTSYVDESLSTDSNDVLLIKLLTPLDESITEDVNFYISQNPYSDDIVKSIILRSAVEKSSTTFKLRGPDISTKLTSNATKKFSLSDEEESKLIEDDAQSAENHFKTTNTEVENLNIDYSDFKNFVKFSSARARLDNFVLKLTNISKLKFKIQETIRKINKLNSDVSSGFLTPIEATRSIEILKNEDIRKYNEGIVEIFKTFTPYDKFLYYDSDNNAWPRETSFNINGFSGAVDGANGLYKLHASRKYDLDKVFLNENNYSWKIIWDYTVSKWKLFQEDTDIFIYSGTSNLNSGFTATERNNTGFANQSSLFKLNLLEGEYTEGTAIFPPELIPTQIIDFQKSDGFAWYKSKAKEADLHDKYNDESLYNSLPEFLIRTNENEEFTLFLGMIGEQFDILHVYTENMTDMASARNSMKKGIPNQLVWFVMNSYGVRLSGRTSDQLTIGKKFEENRDRVWRRVLNNLPYILKTSGTENSIRALFKCYGIPDHLFKIREYGGINYNTDLDDSDANFKIDTLDYALRINEADQYLDIPVDFVIADTNETSVELKLSVGREFFENTNDTITFENTNSATLPANIGTSVGIEKLINSDDDYIIGSNKPRFYTKGKNQDSFIPEMWKTENSVIAISWKNFREGVSFSYPKVNAGTEPSFVTIYSDRGKLEDGTYDPLYTLAEIGAQDTLNGEVVRLSFSFSQDSDTNNGEFRNDEHNLDFRFEGSVAGNHYTISELKQNGYLNNSGYYSILQSNKNWEFGIHRDSTFKEDYGKFYLNFYNTDGILVCPSKLSNPIYFDDDVEYDILITSKQSNTNTDSVISMYVKRMYDSSEVFSSQEDLIVTKYTANNIIQTKNLYFGNYNQQTNFIGTLDKLRIYTTAISENRFIGHINNNQGYDIDNYIELESVLLTKINFDHPYSLISEQSESPMSPMGVGTIKNYALSSNKQDVIAYNFTNTTYPYHFVGKNRSELSDLPAMGGKSFNNNKIRIETQEKVAELNPYSRSTKKSKDRHTIDSNTLGVYFSPTDITNQEIIRFFGQINLGEFIGDPHETYNYCYKKLEGLRKIFFKHGFGKLDIQKYFNLIKSYIDPSLFENLEKIVPARANLISGLLIEPSLLERHKIIPPRIKSSTWIDLEENAKSDKEKITEILNIDFDVGLSDKNIATFGNDRTYITNKQEDYKLTHDSDIKVFKNNSEFTFDYNYCGKLVGEDITDSTRDIFTVHGITEQKGKLFKVEKIKEKKSIGVQYTGKLVNYDIFLNDGIQISGFTDGMETANGIYEFKFKGSSGLPVFTNQSRMWWVFYSSQKVRWIIASDNTVDGGKYLALNQGRQYENYTWIGGNKIAESNTNTPEWFSTGFNNSIQSDNLPQRDTDYFGRVSFISKYDRFIECDAYIHGWVNAELYGVYKGELTERVFSEGSSFKNISKPNDNYIFSGDKKYVFLNGTFRGKLQNGWVGSDQIQQTDSDKNIRVVGFFDGKKYESCDKPHYTSGLINSLVSFDNRDKLVFDFRNYNSNQVRFSSKNFDNINLVKIPNSLEYSNDVNFKFISDYTIQNQGISDVVDLSSGQIKKKHTHKTTDIFYSPNVYDISVTHDIKLKTNSILDIHFLAQGINFKATGSVAIKINGSKVRFNFNKNKYKNCDIISRGNQFHPGSVYNQYGEKVKTNTRNLINTIKESVNYISNEEVINNFENNILNKEDYSLVYVGESLDTFDFIFLISLESKSEINTNLKCENFFENTLITRQTKETVFQHTPMHINNTPQFVRGVDLIKSGRGYTGQEEVEIYGNRPLNWKSSWPQKIKAYKLFNIDTATGIITGVKPDNFLITGTNWITDSTITFNDTPKIKIENPITDSRYANTEKAELRIITGEPTPSVSSIVTLQNYVDLELGDTIGKSLNSANVYFEGRDSVKYDTGLIHTKKINIQTSEKTSSKRLNATEVIVFSNESILDFELYLDAKIKEVMRSDVCGNETPISSDTYEIQITNFYEDDGDIDYGITYTKNREPVNNFFVILNEEKTSEIGESITDEQYVNKISKINDNKYSEGYVRINGFTTIQSSANGIYRFRNDISYCDKFGAYNVPIPTYTNENKEWIITYDEEIRKWKLRNIKNLNFIVSNTKYLEDGFLANKNNNQGFYTGKEVLPNSDNTVDQNGFVYDATKQIIGNKFQEANVSVSNRFKVVPNKLLFKLEKENFNNFLIWKIAIKSKTNNKFIYEIPLVYINSDSQDELFLDKYNSIEAKLKLLNIMQYQETSACNLNFQNAIVWKIKSTNKQSGEFSNKSKINTQGLTYLNATCFSKNENHTLDGRYSYVLDKIINENNSVVEFSEVNRVWKMKTLSRDISLLMNHNYPRCGVYKTTTKNIYGICEYTTADDNGNLAIELRNLTDEYEDANGVYYSYGYLETGEYLFRNNDSNWLFHTSDGGETWELRNDRLHPTLKIEQYSQIDQVGVYTNKSETLKFYINFEIDFIFENTRDFLNVDINSLQLKSDIGELLVYNKIGYEKNISDDMKLNVEVKVVNAEKISKYWSSIPCKNERSVSDFYIHNNLFLKSKNELYVDEVGFDKFKLIFGVENSKDILHTSVEYDTNLSQHSHDTPHVLENFYDNSFKTNVKYKVGDRVYHNDLMWDCTKDIPDNRSVIPGVDFDTGNYWKIFSNNYTKLCVTSIINIKKKQYKDVTQINYHDFEFSNEFVKIFKSQNQFNFGIDESVVCFSNKKYLIEKEYLPFDLAHIGTTKNTVSHGKVRTHTENSYNRNLGVSSNNNETTIDTTTGYVCGKPPIVRTYKKSDTRKTEYEKDSFWFNQDKQHIRQTEQTLIYEKPETDPIISFRFENHDTLQDITLKVTNFNSTETEDANGLYNKINRSYNNTHVFENENGYFIYKTDECWVVQKSNKFNDLQFLENVEYEYTTSETKRIDGDLNGNFGSSSGFSSQTGLIEIISNNIIEKTPTPTPEQTPTPTPTPTPTSRSNESPETPEGILTPTPVPTITPTPEIDDITPTPQETFQTDTAFLFEYGDFAITTKKYDLSKNHHLTELEIAEDLDDQRIIISGIMSLEEIQDREEILSEIPDVAKNFGMLVSNYTKMIDGRITSENINQYGWDSSNTHTNGKFRAFYMSKNQLGLLHKYDNQHIFADYGYFIKSWMGARHIAVKVLNQIDPVTELSATTGLPEGVLLSWKPSYSASYLRIEAQNENTSEWVVVVDNLSQIRATGGYLDTSLEFNEKRKYRVISIGVSGKETTSTTTVGWKLGIPDAPSSLSVSYGKYSNKIELSWDGSSLNSQFNKSDSFTILRSETNEFDDFSTYVAIANDIKETTYTDTNNLNSTLIYWYVVVANNEKTKIMTESEFNKKENWSASVAGKLS